MGMPHLAHGSKHQCQHGIKRTKSCHEPIAVTILAYTHLNLKILNALACIQNCPVTVLQCIKSLLHFLLKSSLLIPAADHQLTTCSCHVLINLLCCPEVMGVWLQEVTLLGSRYSYKIVANQLPRIHYVRHDHAS